MPTATLTARGHIAVPPDVRRALNLEVGGLVQFIPLPSGHYEFRGATAPVEDLKGFFGSWRGPAVTLDEMNAGIGRAAGVKR
ncbi:MAG: type II toxin-antitoxin system PrlF family antitoxin [Propionibacteriaceae bacterium]|jgi:bifunctional DNA-binding transcriptional regulator/antitoxin component of YhaV-PrlF toxin-antitoxin module|nr:type II toxin-antitoxin system PrlF family antitoxin [Propionibacteriaceae bacterium]